MRLKDTEKIKYINERFHQYFDIKLNTNITTAEFANLTIRIEELFNLGDTSSTSTNYSHDIEIDNDFNIEEVFKKEEYKDTEIQKEVRAICTRVIDGDTIEVKIIKTNSEGKPILDENDNIITTNDIVRLVGVNTPEQNSQGYEDSKKFLEKALYSKRYFNHLFIEPEEEEVNNNKHIYLNIDSEKERDVYGRLLAVVIVDNKNLNEILLKEKIAEVMYIPPSEFNPDDWKDPWSSVNLFNYKNDNLALLSRYLRSDMKNIVFTPSGDTNTLYKYEIYKGVIYLRLKPYSEYIRMHILPKAYDCSNDILLFRDEDSIFTQKIDKRSSVYKVYKNKNNINAYFQQNGEDRDRTLISNRDYNIEDWNEQGSLDASKTFCDFSYDISKSTESLNNLQICAGYRYNQTSPYYALHYTGVRDNSGRPEDRCTLIDANIDNVKGDKSNIITQMSYLDSDLSNSEDDIVYIKHDVQIQEEIGNNDHISDIGKLHHKNLKYINDLLYVEEEDSYSFKTWSDPLFLRDYKIETGPGAFKVSGFTGYSGEVNIYLDDIQKRTTSCSKLKGFKSNFIRVTPGEHTIYLKYVDPNSKYPEKESFPENILIDKIPLNVDATVFIKKTEEEIHIDIKVLDFYNEPVKNKEINFNFKPSLYAISMGYDLLFYLNYNIYPENYNLASFNATTDENGEISLIKKLDEIIIDNSISPNFTDLFGNTGAYELYLEFPSDEKYILENKKIYKEISDINDLYNVRTFGNVYIVQK